MQDDFIVIDTEGSAQISELAIINAQGDTLYQAINPHHSHYDVPSAHKQSCRQLLQALCLHGKHKKLVCHHAQHDKQILQRSFAQAGLDYPHFSFICTWQLAKQTWADLSSYSLAYLCQHQQLQCDGRYFTENQAHSAIYDAQFTYQLYQSLIMQTSKPNTENRESSQRNPFSNSRVDTPFQDYLDFGGMHQQAFSSLSTIIDDIKQDANQQSRGAVVLGKAGSGKTHLMMRLAQQRLQNNRLLFIRQPNNPEHVMFHIYTRMLESFVENIPDTQYSQLEYLLGKSFATILLKMLANKASMTKAERSLHETLSENHLNIYTVINQRSSEAKRRAWDVVEKTTLDWWGQTYGFSGYAGMLIKGLIKYCRYTDPRYRELVRRWLAGNHLSNRELQQIGLDDWEDNLTREEFSLAAISVFGKLSIVDEPLIIIFDQLEGLKYNQDLLTVFGEASKEIFTHVPNSLIIFNLFPDRWQYFHTFFDASITERMGQHQLNLILPPQDALKAMLALKANQQNTDLDSLFSQADLGVILQQDSIRAVLNCAADYYRFNIEGVALPSSYDHNEAAFDSKLHEDIAQIKVTLQQLQQQLQLNQHVQTASTPVVHDTVSPKQTKHIPQQANLNIKMPAPVQTKPQQREQLNSYLQQQAEKLTEKYTKKTIVSASDDVGKLHTIFNTLQPLFGYQLDVMRLGKRKLPEHVLVRHLNKQHIIGFLHVNNYRSFDPRLANFNELVVNYKDARFALFRDASEEPIVSQKGLAEIEKLQNSDNGNFIYMNKANRHQFELIYTTITDLQNQDLDSNISSVYHALEAYIGLDYWLFRAVK